MTARRSQIPPLAVLPMKRVRETPGPLYQRLIECLAASICLDAAPLEKRLPSERELERSGGFSMITVKRALHELESLGILARKQGSGSYPLRRPSVGDLLKIVQPRRLAVFSEPFSRSATAMRYDLLYFLQKMLAGEGTTLSLIDEESIGRFDAFDGLFLMSRTLPVGLARRKTGAKVFVGASTEPAEVTGIDSVEIDLRDAMEKAAAFIGATGCRHLCFFGSDSAEWQGGKEMLRHLSASLGAACSIDSFFGSSEAVYDNARAWLRRNKAKPAVFFSALYLCTGALIRAAEAMGRPIGDQLPLLAFGASNALFKDVVDLRLVTVNREEMARLALEQMLVRIIAPGIPARVQPIRVVAI